jgi:hypothetical protein
VYRKDVWTMSTVVDELLEGMEVFDVDGTKVGKVVQFDKVLGYFETLGTFAGPRYVPFFAIERIAKSGIYLNVMKSVVSHVYNHMPGVRPNVTADGRLTGDGTVASGYTGQAVPLDAQALWAVREEIYIGATVLDVDDKNLGTIQAYDGDTGYMRIEKDGFTVKDMFLPVTSVSFLDEQGIHLAEAKDTLMSRYRKMPEVARGFYGP